MAIHEVQSPIPGIFYRRPSPDQPEFFTIGDTVSAGDTIGLVEVMKQFAEIKAGADGVITAFHVDNEALIGPGDLIASIQTGA